MSRIVVRTQVLILLPGLILLFPNIWIVSWIVAVVIHECFHILALYLLGIEIHSLEIGIRGAKISTGPVTRIQELIVALAGPVGALIILVFFRYLPRVSICIIAQSIYNLLPVYPLDGGRVMRSVLLLNMKEQRVSVFEKCIFYIAILGLLAAGLWLDLGILPFILCIGLFVKNRNANIPCKD